MYLSQLTFISVLFYYKDLRLNFPLKTTSLSWTSPRRIETGLRLAPRSLETGLGPRGLKKYWDLVWSDGCFLHRAIGHVMSSLFYPLFTFLLLAMVIAYWAVTAVYPPRPCSSSPLIIEQFKGPRLHTTWAVASYRTWCSDYNGCLVQGLLVYFRLAVYQVSYLKEQCYFQYKPSL